MDVVIDVDYVTLRFTAVSASDGAPIEGVDFAIAPSGSPLAEPMWTGRHRTRTNELGQGQAAAAPGDYILQASRGGYRVLEQQVILHQETQELVLRLEPVSGTMVRMTGSVLPPHRAGAVFFALEDEAGQLLLQGMVTQNEIEDSDRLRLPELDLRSVRVKLLVRGGMPDSVSYGEGMLVPGGETEVWMEERATLTATVPALVGARESATATLIDDQGRTWASPLAAMSQHQQTGTSGSFTLSPVPQGRYRVLVTSESGQEWETEVAVVAGTQQVILE